MSRKFGTRRDNFFKSSNITSPLTTVQDVLNGSRLTNGHTTASPSISRRVVIGGDETVHVNGHNKSTIDNNLVGYSSLPNQLYRRSIRHGFEFNVMVAGVSGLGKSTLVNSLFLSEFYSNDHPRPSKRTKESTTKIGTSTVLLKEKNVSLRLTLIDTPGFGDAIDNSNCWQPIVDYLHARFNSELANEHKVDRSGSRTGGYDGRVHACLYFIQPTGHALKPLDLEFLRRIHEKVNVIPVIAKADTLTAEELRLFKQTVSQSLQQNEIHFYDFPDLPHVDPESLDQIKKMRARIPLAVVGSASSKAKRVREYPWGTVDVDSLDHSDLTALKKLMLGTHLQHLKDTTVTNHYERYRAEELNRLAHAGNFSTQEGRGPMTLMEEEKRNHDTKMQRMASEMEAVFEHKVKEKADKLRDSSLELERRAERMTCQLDDERHDLEGQWQHFETERAVWEAANKDWVNITNSLEREKGGSHHVGKQKKKGLLF